MERCTGPQAIKQSGGDVVTEIPKDFRKILTAYLREYIDRIPLDDEKVQNLEYNSEVYKEVIEGINVELELYSRIEKDGRSAAVFLCADYATLRGNLNPSSAMIEYTFDIPLGMRTKVPKGFRKTLAKYLDEYLSDLPLDDEKVQALEGEVECKKGVVDQVNIRRYLECRTKEGGRSAIITASAFYPTFFGELFSVNRKIEYTFDTLDA